MSPDTGVSRKDEALLSPGTGVSRKDEALLSPGTGVSRKDEALSSPDTGVSRKDEALLSPGTGVASEDGTRASLDMGAVSQDEARAPQGMGVSRKDEALASQGAGGSFEEGTPSLQGTAASPKEEALWLLESLTPGTPVNNLSVACAVDGHLDASRLDAALTAVLRRHEALRTVYRSDGARLVKRVAGPDEFRLALVRTESAGEPTEDDLAPVTAVPFALDGGPMLRAALFRSPDRDVFCVTAHHLVFDGVSAPVLLRELVTAYEHADGRPGEGLAPVPVWTAPQPGPESLAFWRRELAGANTEALQPACGEPEPDRPTLAAADTSRTLPPQTAAALRKLGEELEVPESAVLLAAYYVLLEAHGAGPDLIIGSPVDVRPEHAARTIGYHSTYVPLRLRVDREETVRDLVRRSSERLLTAAVHADVAVDAHTDLMPAAGYGGRRSLPFRHLFEHQAGRGPAAFTLGGLAATPFPAGSGCAKFDLHLSVTSADDAVTVRAVHRTELFERSYAELLLARYEAVLASFADDPDRAVGEVRWWSERDHEIVRAANDTAGPVGFPSVLDAVRDHVRRAPDSVAVVEDDRSVGYGLLWDAAHTVSALLRDTGVRAGDIVAIALPRGPELVAAVLGVWLTGAAYLPLDAAHPEERIRFQLSDSGAKVLVATEAMTLFAGDGLVVLTTPSVEEAADRRANDVRPVVADVQPGAGTIEVRPVAADVRPVMADASPGAVDLPSVAADVPPGTVDLPSVAADVSPGTVGLSSVSVDVPSVSVDPASCAYLIYTSGSTGRPKGTLITHAALANVASHFTEQLGATPADTMLWTTTFAFDMSGVELLVSLVSGCRLAAAPDRARSDGRVLRELVERYDVRFLQATPTTWRLVIDRMADCLRGRSVIVGGETVPVPLARQLVAAGCRLHHAYGPTETAIWSTSRVVTDEPEARLDVGRPIRNTQVHVVDRHGRDLPVGVSGELRISGAGVAIGYHGRPELNAQRFGEHPEYGRFYATGDVARWREDGLIDLFGRIDRQVKLRGHRIELGEIEATLLAHPEVGAAAVIMVGDPSSDAVLIGCLEPAAGSLDTGSVWAHARARLSRSMLPGDLVTVDAMPVNASGKVDYLALGRMVADRQVRPAAPVLRTDHPDLDELTARLTALWRSVLRREDVDADTDFFAHGGDSMLAAVAMQELQNMSGVSLSLTEVFERRTPRELAARIRDTAQREEAAPAG
ncbi:AMP-binding protein [Streptomyces sp. NPDC020800]|uniref:non-ribosomal peptide synthetase n=1 Tax=Streptomyces sp. NPDC020800 TaxID=3365092 RepID=UPI0037BB41EF